MNIQSYQYDRGGMWALKDYKTPLEPKWNHIQNYMPKGEKINILTESAKKKKFVPAPNAYIKQIKWTDISNKKPTGFQKFLKCKRITFTDQILERKKLKEPGPATYKEIEKNYKYLHKV